jgi:hypothetical protein
MFISSNQFIGLQTDRKELVFLFAAPLCAER